MPLLQVAIGAGRRRQTGAIPLQRGAVGTPKRDDLFIVAGPPGHLDIIGSLLQAQPLLSAPLRKYASTGAVSPDLA